MSDKKSEQSLIPMIATIIVGIAAVAAVVVLIVISSGNKSGENSSDGGGISVASQFRPSQELVDECGYKAHDLLQDHCEIIRLFISEGLPHLDEPYGNEPEDGLYTVNSTKYTSMQQIEDLVRSVYIDSVAEKILHNIDGNGLSVYREREVFEDIIYSEPEDPDASESRPAYQRKTVLGIDAGFVPDEDYDKAWDSSRIVVSPASETQCNLTIYLGADESTDLSTVDSQYVLETVMRNDNGEWRLTAFAH